MQLHARIGFLVVTLLCSTFGHPSQKDEAVVRSVKTSSGRDAFESESSSLSRTELENDGNDYKSHFSEYEAAAAESNHANEESEFILDSGNGETSMVKSNKRSNKSSSSAYSKSSRTEIEEDSSDDHFDFSNDDLEMTRSSKYEKAQKSSSSASHKSNSVRSIIDTSDDDDDDEFVNLQKTSSSFTEEKEFESETKESSFISRDFDFDDNQNGVKSKKNRNMEESLIGESPQHVFGKKQKKATGIGSTSLGTDTRVGKPENVKEKGTKKSSGTKKSVKNSEDKLKSENQQSTLQNNPVIGGSQKPLEVRSLLVENKPVEKITELETEEKLHGDVAGSEVEKIEISSQPSQPLTIKNTPENELNILNDVTSSNLQTEEAQIMANTEFSSNNDQKHTPSLPYNEQPIIDTTVPSICSTPKQDTILMKEETESLTADIKSAENKNTIVSSTLPQNIQTGTVVEETSTSCNALSSSEKIETLSTNVASNIPEIEAQLIPSPSPTLLPAPQLNSPPCTSIPTSSPTLLPSMGLPVAPNTGNSLQTTSVSEISSNEKEKVTDTLIENGVQTISAPLTNSVIVSDTTQATSISESTSSEYQKIMESNTQYAPSEMYPYGNNFGVYPTHSSQNAPFLTSPDQFPHGQPGYPPDSSQSTNMNYYGHPFNLFAGFVSYPLYAFPPLPPRCTCMNHPTSQYPEGYPGQTKSPNIPQQNLAPAIPTIPTVVPTLASNSPGTSSTLPDTLLSEEVRDLEISPLSPELSLIPENSLGTELPSLPVASESLLPETSLLTPGLSIPEVTQKPKPLRPSEELMVNKHIPSYIIEDLEKRFEEAKIEILEKYAVYPEDITEIIETTEEQSLSYEYIILGTQAGGLSALKALTQTGKRVLILDDARLPPCESYSAVHRLSLIDSSFTTSYSARAPLTDVEKKIYSSKIVGGPSCYDLGVWDHGAMQKFGQWSQTCKAWSWDKVVSYFQDIENVEDIGYLNGPINICHNEPDSPLTHQIVQSFTDIGIKKVKYDLESARQEPGLVLLPSMYDNKANLNFAERMFTEVKNKENLHMALGVQTVRIIFESDRATGVEVVTKDGKTRVIRVTEELIVAFGVINTVKLLQHSGIGDASLLQKYQIPVLRDLPLLGKEILLNPMYPGMFIKCQKGSLLDTLDSDFLALGYVFKETSMQTSLASSFYKIFLQVQGASEPNIQINIFTFSSRTTERLLYFMKGLFSFNQETIDFVMEEVVDHDIMFLVPQLLDLEIRAEVSISDGDYKSSPLIDTHLYESENDMLAMQKTLGVIRKISRSSTLKKIGADLVQIPVKKCGPTKFSKDFNECSVRELSVLSLHSLGGAIMGSDEKTSVVDEQLRLHGIQNCRLLNTAVVPNGVAADSSAISAVIGRYGADMITKKIQI